MKILLVMQHTGFTFHYESTLQLLAERGHQIVVAHDRQQTSPQLARLVSEFANITTDQLPRRRGERWLEFLTALRTFQDYLRYLEPRYTAAHYLRRRVEEKVVPWLRGVGKVAQALGPWALAFVNAVLRLIERTIPVSPAVREFIANHRPDLVLVTPLVDTGSRQVDYIRAAQAMRIPVGLCVASWDNLTNKGLMRVVPDRVFVWNEVQRDEAVTMHRVPRDRVVITGAQSFDHWFQWKPSSSRAAFCRGVGLDPSEPYVLFVGSTVGIAADEPIFVERWVRALRSSGYPDFDRLGILVRPHPKQWQRWKDVSLSGLGNTAVQISRPPVEAASRSEYFDALFHSVAVIGVNTSAIIEAAIVGRRVFTLLAPEFEETQEGTLHFHYLAAANHGPLHVAKTIEEHCAQVAAAVKAGGGVDDPERRFVRSFIRPHGLEVPAAPLLANAIEALAGARRDYAAGFVPKTVQL